MKKRYAFFLIMSILVIGLFACSSDVDEDANADGGDEVTLKLSEAQVSDYPDAIAEEEFAEKVEELSDGRITVDVYTEGQLGDEKETIEQTQVDAIDIGRANAGPLAEFADSLKIFNFPFLFESREHLWDSLDNSLKDEIFTDLEEEADLVGLAIYDAGARSFYTNDPVENLEDLQGKKIRVMENDLLVEGFNQLGVSPTPLEASEVYSALQSGVIDGGENNASTYVADGHYEVAENFTLSEHLRIPGVLFMSKSAFDSLSKEDQEIIKEAAEDSEKTQLEEFDDYTEEAMDEIEEAGNNIIEFSEEQQDEFREKMQPFYDEYEDDYGDMIEEIENSK